MNQFEEVIREESINICEQLNSYTSREEKQSSGEERAARTGCVNYGLSRCLNRVTVAISATLMLVAVWTFYCFFNNKSDGLFKGFGNLFSYWETMFLYPYAHRFTLGDACSEIGLTVGLALLTTLLGGITAVFLGLLASHNLVSKQVASTIKGLMVLIRAVPTLVWILIFTVIMGLGLVALIIGLTIPSISYLAKAYTDSYEELDRSVIEALRASGSNWWQIVFQAVIPSASTEMHSWSFLRFVLNFANVLALGAIAGASGLGLDLSLANGFYFDLSEGGLVTYLLLVFTILLEVGTIKKGCKKWEYRKELIEGVDPTGNRQK